MLARDNGVAWSYRAAAAAAHRGRAIDTFATRHASEPATREQVRILRSARGEPSRLALSTDSGETKESALVDRDAQAMGTQAQMRARYEPDLPCAHARAAGDGARAQDTHGAARLRPRLAEGRRGARGTEGRRSASRS